MSHLEIALAVVASLRASAGKGQLQGRCKRARAASQSKLDIIKPSFVWPSMAPSCRKHPRVAPGAVIKAIFFACALLCAPSSVLSGEAFPCDLFFETSSDFSDGSSKVISFDNFHSDPSLNYPQAMQCAVTFFCLNTSTACGCSDASQPMFSFDVPLQFSAVDDLQAGLQSGDVVQRISRRARSLSSRLHRRPSCRAARTTRQRLRPRSMPRTRLKGACVQ